MAQVYRVLLQRKFKNGDSDASYNIEVDLPLDAGAIPTRKMTQFGAIGGLNPETQHVAPFSLYTNGEMDFGTGYANDRWGRTDLLSGRAITVGEYFAFNLDSEDEELTYQVTGLLPLV